MKKKRYRKKKKKRNGKDERIPFVVWFKEDKKENIYQNNIKLNINFKIMIKKFILNLHSPP